MNSFSLSQAQATRNFGLWSQVLPDDVGIRKALKAVSRMLDSRVGGHRRGSLATPTMQAVQDSWMVLVTRCTLGMWGFVATFCEKASRGALSVLFVIELTGKLVLSCMI